MLQQSERDQHQFGRPTQKNKKIKPETAAFERTNATGEAKNKLSNIR